MRRKDREIINQSEIIEIVEKCDVCRIALSLNNIPYIVPMNYGYEYIDDKLTLYFHGATEGKKLEIISNNPSAAFEIDCEHKLIEGDLASSYSMEYESVIGNGKIVLCVDKISKIHALEKLMKKYAPDKEFAFPDNMLSAVTVFKLEVADFSGKRNRRTK